MFKKSKIIVGAALLAVSVLSFTLPQQAEAINLGSIAGKAVGAAKEQQEINKALNYYDNEGRHELFEALKRRQQRLQCQCHAWPHYAAYDPGHRQKRRNHQ